MSRLKAVSYVVGGLVVFLTVAGLLFGRSPGFVPLPPSVQRITANSGAVVGTLIQPYRARYTMSTNALGVRVSPSIMDVIVTETADGLQIVYDFAPDDPDVQDRILLRRESLAPVTREFPGQSISFHGTRMKVEVHRPDATVDTVIRTYGGNVFEVSVLDLVAVAALEELLRTPQ